MLVCSLLPLRFRWVLAGPGADSGAILVGSGTDFGVFWAAWNRIRVDGGCLGNDFWLDFGWKLVSL